MSIYDKVGKWTPLVAAILVLGAFGVSVSSGLFSGGIESVTMLGTGEINVEHKAAKIIPFSSEKTGALFDLVLTIPEKSKYLKSGDDLLVSLELTNFGGPGKTPTMITYIITNDAGEIVMIEHENREVETQSSFLKEIDLPEGMYGSYKIFVEMLYSDTSASAQDEFRVRIF